MTEALRKKREEIEERLDRISRLYQALDALIGELPHDIPDNVRDWTINRVMGDEELSELIESIEGRRPPRLILVGRTGAGKSTLINALCGQYLAEISDVRVGTRTAEAFSYESFGKTLFEVIDTRGLGDAVDEASSRGAVEDLKEAVRNFSPDAVLFLQKADERGYRDEDVRILREIRGLFERELPVIALASQVDKLEPSREKVPEEYPERKRQNIQEAVQQLHEDLVNDGIEPLETLPVSSYVEWETDPTELASPEDRQHLSIRFDGRYNIDRLLDLLEDNIDLEAGIVLMLAARLDRLARRIADRFIRIFAAISGAVGSTPIPTSDIFVLMPLQVLLIMLIAYLGGRDLNYSSARELLFSIGVAGPAGYGLRMLFQQGSKLANLLYPGAGSALSGSIAAGGTYGIGRAASAYFLRETSEEELEEIARESARSYRDEVEDDDFDVPEPTA